MEWGIRSWITTMRNEPEAKPRSGTSIASKLSNKKNPPREPMSIVPEVKKLISKAYLVE